MTENKIFENNKRIHLTFHFKEMPQQWVQFNVIQVEFYGPTVASCHHVQP